MATEPFAAEPLAAGTTSAETSAAGSGPGWSTRPRAALVAGALLAGGLVATLLVVATPLGIVALTLGPGLAVARHRRLGGRERRRRTDALPQSLDLCTVVLGAGGSINDAVRALADHGPDPVGWAAARTLKRSAAGNRFDDSLRWFRAELGPAFQPLTGALLLGHEQGGAIGLLLARLAGDASASRRRLGEERARRLPVALLVPLVICSLPAVLIGAVIPLAIVALGQIDF